MPAIPNLRNLRDAAKEVTTALPAQNTANQTAAIDLEQTYGGHIEEIAFELEVPATPSLANGQTLTFTVQDSADGTSFATIDPAISTVVTGGGGGGPAKTVRFRLPPLARRYVRLNQAASATAGNNTAVSTTFRALF